MNVKGYKILSKIITFLTTCFNRVESHKSTAEWGFIAELLGEERHTKKKNSVKFLVSSESESTVISLKIQTFLKLNEFFNRKTKRKLKI